MSHLITSTASHSPYETARVHAHPGQFNFELSYLNVAPLGRDSFVTVGVNQNLTCWNARTFETQDFWAGALRGMCVATDGDIIATGHKPPKMPWEVRVGSIQNTTQPVQTLEGAAGDIYGLSVSGQMIAGGGQDTRVHVWTLSSDDTWQESRLKPAHQRSILAMDLGANRLATASADKTIGLWDMTTLAHLASLEGHTDAVTCVSLQEHELYSGSRDHCLRSWDLRSPQQSTATWTGHTLQLTGVVAASEGIVTCSDDETVRLWDRRGGHIHLDRFQSSVTCLTTLQNGSIVAGSLDAELHVLDLRKIESASSMP